MDRAAPTVRTYVRVSTDEQALSGYSLLAQTDQLERLAAARGWSITGRHVDDGYSAKDTNRPALQTLLNQAGPGEVVLVYKLDRLTRSVRDLDDLLREFDRRGLMFQSATEQFETTTASGRLFLRIVTEIAQWERESIAERSAMGKRKKVELGEWPGGPVPFGYRAEPSDRIKAGRSLLRLVPDPERAHVVRAIFERYLTGHGMRALCLWLNDEMGVRTAGGARWRVSTVARLLTNPLYCGDVVHGRRSGRVLTRVQGTHPPLIARDVFVQVEALFANRKHLAPRQATGHYPLSGVARCGTCGGAIDSCRRRPLSGYIYRCRNHVNGVGCGDGILPPLASIPGEMAESRLIAALAELPTPDRFDMFADQDNQEPADLRHAERLRLDAERAEADAAIHRWDRAYESGAIPLHDYKSKVSPYRDRLALMQTRLDELPFAPTVPPAPAAYDLPLAWRRLTPPERKMLLLRFLSAFDLEVLLHPDRRVEVRPRAPAPPPPLAEVPNRPAGIALGHRAAIRPARGTAT